MSPELQDLLDDAARAPRRPLDVGAIHRRGRRSRTTELVAALAGTALLIGGVAIGVDQLSDGPAPAPFIEGPEATPSEPEPSPSGAPGRPDQVVTPAHLGTDVLLAVDAADGGDGHVLKLFANGETFRMPVEARAPSRLPMHADGAGGFVYQPGTGGGASRPILEVGASGAEAVRLPATDDPGDVYALVGRTETGSIVAHRIGVDPTDTVVELLEVGHLGEPRRVLASAAAGFESTVLAAASLEVTVYVRAELPDQHGVRTSIVVDPPDGEPTVVWRGDDQAGEEAIDVEIDGDPSGGALVLVRTADGAELLTVDLFAAEPTVGDRIEVPLDLGTDATDVQATEISIHDGYVLVNRRTDDRWLRPLVQDLQTAAWSVFERPGRALLGHPVVPVDDTVTPACVEDVTGRNAPPSDAATHLYLSCRGESEPWHVYRTDSDQQRTGDVAADVRATLERLFAGVGPDLEEQGYSTSAEVPGIAVRGVTFDGGTLVVDFDFSRVTMWSFTASHAGAAFHSVLLANVLQYPQVEVLELRESGSCERYPTFFESDGCFRFTAEADAPWNGQRPFDGPP